MNELAQHIETLLLENDCVIIPNFGGFVTHYSPASYVKANNLFLPPARTVGFNPQLRLNDGVLVQSYMSAYGTDFSHATRMVEKDVNELVTLLHEEGKAKLANIGELSCDIYGNYEFKPADDKLTAPSFYGLDSFEMPELAAETQEEKVLIPTITNLPTRKKTYQINISRAFLRNTVAAVVAIVLFFAFSTPVENTYISPNNYAQLLPGEWFRQLEKQSVAMTPVAVHTDPPQKVSAKAVPSKTTVTPSAKKAETTQKKEAAQKKDSTQRKEVKPVTVKEVKVAQPKKAAAKPAAKPDANRPFHIIVAGGIGLKDAEAMAKTLRGKGFPEAMALQTDGKVRVSIRSFDNRAEATRQLLELRKNKTYQNAWLLAK